VVDSYLLNDSDPPTAATLAAATAAVETLPVGSRYGEQWQVI
jgi:hypothetical protein